MIHPSSIAGSVVAPGAGSVSSSPLTGSAYGDAPGDALPFLQTHRRSNQDVQNQISTCRGRRRDLQAKWNPPPSNSSIGTPSSEKTSRYPRRKRPRFMIARPYPGAPGGDELIPPDERRTGDGQSSRYISLRLVPPPSTGAMTTTCPVFESQTGADSAGLFAL